MSDTTNETEVQHAADTAREGRVERLLCHVLRTFTMHGIRPSVDLAHTGLALAASLFQHRATREQVVAAAGHWWDAMTEIEAFTPTDPVPDRQPAAPGVASEDGLDKISHLMANALTDMLPENTGFVLVLSGEFADGPTAVYRSNGERPAVIVMLKELAEHLQKALVH